jgi:MoxR-like ATPase
MVMATQNPIEYEGTFPLPEAQLDRFLLRITLGYPGFADEITIIERQQRQHPIETLGAVTTDQEIFELQNTVRRVYVDRLIEEYVVHLVGATRRHGDASLGASPRASLALFRTSQASAFLHGRDHVLPTDVQELAEPVLAHRIIISPQARMRGVDGRQVARAVLREVPGPTPPEGGWGPPPRGVLS